MLLLNLALLCRYPATATKARGLGLGKGSEAPEKMFITGMNLDLQFRPFADDFDLEQCRFGLPAVESRLQP
jgi:hypothetical protein